MSDIPNNSAPYWLNILNPEAFPDVSLALREPDGLLAIGGDLSVKRLLAAYRQGIFPWYSDDQPILWWSPDPRMVLFPEQLHIAKSLRKTLNKGIFTITIDKAFNDVITACAKPRNYTDETWITDDMNLAYQHLHQQGYAHSVECWYGDKLVGGLYGVSIGKVFFGESMFSTMTDTSKVAFVYLVRQLQQWDFKLIDCQVYSEHLASLGATNIPREKFISLLDEYCDKPKAVSCWSALQEGNVIEPDLKL